MTFSEVQKKNSWNEEGLCWELDYNYCAQKANNDQIDDDSDNEITVSVELDHVSQLFFKYTG